MRHLGPIKVLVVDRSLQFNRVLTRELGRGRGIQVVGTAFDGLQAREVILRHRPDVIVVDVSNPDGIELVHKLRQVYPVPVFACSDGAPSAALRAVRASGAGAIDLFVKPAPNETTAIQALAAELVARMHVAVEARPTATHPMPAQWHAPPFAATGLSPGRYVVAVGASTGGPEAVRSLLANVPSDFPATVIVQHMPANFTPSFAERLNQYSPVSVREARDGQQVGVGEAVVARGDTHLVVETCGAGWRVRYTDQRRVNRHCPSVDVLFHSVAQAARTRGIGVLLTGMGDDGARGLLAMRQAGGITVTQDRRTSVVYGMPKVAVELNASQASAKPEDIPALVVRLLGQPSKKTATTSGPAS